MSNPVDASLPPPAAPTGSSPGWLIAPIVAGLLAFTAAVVGWRGVDLPAQVYRVGLFHRDGLTLWDSQWYGGHWTLNYSVIFPPIAGILGVQFTEIVSAAAAALAFDRLVENHFGRAARVGALLFAFGTLAEVAIGQLPFLLGEAFALSAYWATTRGRTRLAVPLAALASLASPLAGAFLALAVVAGLVARWPARRIELGLVAAGAAIPLVGLGALFPGQGAMPFPAIDFLWLVAVFVVVCLLIPSRERGLRIGVGLYLVCVVASFALPTPVGGNISRLGECLGGPLVLCLLWSHRRRMLAALVVPLVLLQWVPAVASFTSDRSDPSTRAGYFGPLLAYLADHVDPPGRVEIVPTRLHWEVAYAAPTVPLARGWERQLDTADNPLFYSSDRLTDASYLGWLLDSGVRYVALPDVPLDYAAVGEGRLIASGVSGLRMVWRNPHWRVFEVLGGSGIVQGPGRLRRLDGGQVILDATAPGTIVVRVRYSGRWTLVQGTGCVHEAAGGWIAIDTSTQGELHLALDLVHSADNSCLR